MSNKDLSIRVETEFPDNTVLRPESFLSTLYRDTFSRTKLTPKQREYAEKLKAIFENSENQHNKKDTLAYFKTLDEESRNAIKSNAEYGWIIRTSQLRGI